MANKCESLINVVIDNKLKMLISLTKRRPPRNILYAVGESKLANVGCPNGLKFPQILVNALEVKYA